MGVASVTPVASLAAGSSGFGIPIDLLFHLVGYAVLTVLLLRAGLAPWAAVLLAVSFGAGIEVVQGPLPYRSRSLLDAGVNLAGGVLAWLGVAVARCRARRRSQS